MSRFSALLVLVVVTITANYYSSQASAQALPQAPSSDQQVINDPAEYKAYAAALNTQNPYTAEAFVTRYPQSSGLREVLEHLIAPYLEPEYQASRYSNSDAKVLELAKRLRQIAPDDVRALGVITALDRARVSAGIQGVIKEMCVDSQSGLQQLPAWQMPEGMKRLEFDKLRDRLADTFDGAAGLCALQSKDFATARAFYEEAFRINPTKIEDVYQLTISDLAMNPIDAKGFWYCKTLQLLRRQTQPRPERTLAKYCQAKYREYRGGDVGWDRIVEQAGAQNTVPPDFAARLKNGPKLSEGQRP
jgi:tetratricopeptide (TPR) repeat protein